MPSLPSGRHLHVLAAVCVALATLTACSSGGGEKATPVTPANSSAGSAAGSAGGPIGTSPGGVTTKIDAPPESTEEQYAQACATAKAWMDEKGGDPHTLVEPYLKEVQTSMPAGRAAFGKTWTELSTPQQAAVIVAANAAADGGC